MGPTGHSGDAGGKGGGNKWGHFRIPVYKTVTTPAHRGKSSSKGPGPMIPGTTKQVVTGYSRKWVAVGSPTYKRLASKGIIPNGFSTSGARPDRNTTALNAKGGIKNPNAGGPTHSQDVVMDAKGAIHASTTGTGTNPGDRSQGPHPKAPPHTKQLQSLADQLGNPNTQQLEGSGLAQAQANLQFDSQINDTNRQIGLGHAQHAQNLQDIQDWFGQATKANDAARARNAQVTSQSSGAMQNAIQMVLASIGGSANANAGMVGAQGLGDLHSILGAGQGQSDFLNSMGTSIAQQQAGDASAQNALDNTAASQLQQSLADLLGQKGQQLVVNQNNVRAFNNAARQTNFGNRTGKLDTLAGLAQTAQNLALSKLKLQQAGGGGGGGPATPSFARMNFQQKDTAIKTLMAGPGGQGVSFKTALARAAQFGWNPVNVAPILRTYYPAGTNFNA